MPSKTKLNAIVKALELLEDIIRSKPYITNDDSAIGSLGAVATQVGRNVPELKGYAVGKADETPYNTFDEDGDPITVDPRADRKAANAALLS